MRSCHQPHDSKSPFACVARLVHARIFSCAVWCSNSTSICCLYLHPNSRRLCPFVPSLSNSKCLQLLKEVLGDDRIIQFRQFPSTDSCRWIRSLRLCLKSCFCHWLKTRQLSSQSSSFNRFRKRNRSSLSIKTHGQPLPAFSCETLPARFFVFLTHLWSL